MYLCAHLYILFANCMKQLINKAFFFAHAIETFYPIEMNEKQTKPSFYQTISTSRIASSFAVEKYSDLDQIY